MDEGIFIPYGSISGPVCPCIVFLNMPMPNHPIRNAAPV